MFTDGIYKIYKKSAPATVLGVLEISDDGHSTEAKLAAGQTWSITLPTDEPLVFEGVAKAPDGEFPVEGTATSEWQDWVPGASTEETGHGGEMIEKYTGGKWVLHGYDFVNDDNPQLRHCGFAESGYPLTGGVGAKYAISRQADIGSVGALETKLNGVWGGTWHGYEVTETYD